jgi:prolyl oligopeptidase
MKAPTILGLACLVAFPSVVLAKQPEEGAWLADWNLPRTRAWADERNVEYRRFVNALPQRAAIEADLRAAFASSSAPSTHQVQTAGGTTWLLRSLPGHPHPVITRGGSHVVFDPATMKRPGTWTIDWFVPSPDGRRLAVSVSPDGTERGILHIVDPDTGATLEPPIDNVSNATAGGDLAWMPDGSAFLYTRYPQTTDAAKGAVNQRLYLHRLGSDALQDPMELGAALGPLVEFRVMTQARSGRAIAWAQDGDSGRFSVFLRRGAGRWDRIADWNDGVFQPLFGGGDEILLLSYAGAPRGRVLRLDWNARDIDAAKPFIPERPDAALGPSFYSKGTPTALWTPEGLHLIYQAGGPNLLVTHDAAGHLVRSDDFGTPTAVTGLSALPDSGIALSTETFLRGSAWFRRSADGSTTPLLTDEGPPARWQDIETVRLDARSKDGTSIPYTVLKRAGLTTPSPVLVGAYGGFGSSRRPTFDPSLKVLLDRGVAIADANIRGGGEFGQRWREAAMREGRQRAYDDFQAVLGDIHSRGISTPALTAIEGASNGGLLMGVTLTQRPDLARAVLAEVGLYDMLRFEKGVNGAFNVAEYGRLSVPRERAAMLAYSPLQNVRAGVNYPAVLFTVGANDPRVDPAHSRRMLAALRRADPDDDPVLLRTDFDAGHGYSTSTSDHVSNRADAFAFLLSRFEAAGWKEPKH